MNFAGLIKGNNKAEVGFDDLQADMAEALEESLRIDDPAPAQDNAVAAVFEDNLTDQAKDMETRADLPDEISAPTEAQADEVEAAHRLTAHTQSRLAALNSFDKLYGDAQEHLREIDAKLTEVTTSHHLTRQFFTILQTDIHRANELELGNAELLAEQRRLSDQIQELNKRDQEREGAVEAMQQREASLVHDRDTLRADLATAKLDLVEAVNTVARNDAELGDLVKTLSARTVEIERRSRENEVLREKQVSLSIDLDKALQREAEVRRKLDETTAIHANEMSRNSELLGALGKSEKEVLRLQKALEIANAKQAEMEDEARVMEAERQTEAVRNLAELRGLRAETQSLQSRLEQASDSYNEAASEIGKLKAELSDSTAEKLVADERLSQLMMEAELDKQKLSTATANVSQLSLDQASEQMQLDVYRQECEDLRAEIATLNDRIKELLPHERMYRVAKARLRDMGSPAAEPAAAPVEEVVRRTPARGRVGSTARSAANGSRR
jgi:DNA repair exonuclease SbcCD ATPase subunit